MIIHDLPDRRRILLAGASFLTLSACGSLLGPSEAPGQIFVLSPQLPSVPRSLPPTVQLAIARPETSTSLTTDRIALSRNQTFDYYAGAQWTDATPQLLQNLLIDALEKGGAPSSVAKDMEGIHVNYIVQSEIHSFEARYDHGDAAPTVVIDVSVKVVSAAKGEIVDAHRFHEESAASANSIPAVVAAFNATLAVILPEIAHWVLDLARDTPPRK
jgi:cholesterol transport system auxiliary component